MKRLIFLLLLLPVLCWGDWNPYIAGQTIASGGEDGFAGASTSGSLTGTEEYPTTSRTFFSAFSASSSGDVSYIFIDLGEALGSYDKPGIWNSSGTKLAEASNCSPTNISGTLYRFALDSTIEITASTTYWLGASLMDGIHLRYTGSSGSVYADTTSIAGGSCPTNESSITQNIDYGSSYTFSGTMKVWVTNDANDY